MKKLAVWTLMLMAVAAVAGPPHVDTISTNSVKIIPEQGFVDSADWIGATNTYAQGAIVHSSNNYYMATIGGIATNNAPSHSVGTADTKNDGVTWRAFDKRRRKGLAVVNTSTNTAFISLGYPAVSGSGIQLNASGGAFTIDAEFQGAVYAIGSAAGTTVSSTTW